MRYLFIFALLTVFIGCATVNTVPEAAEDESVSFVNVCGSPYKLTQDCSFISPTRATKKIQIDGFEVKIAGSEAGDVVFVADSKIIGNRFKDSFKFKINSPSHCEAANDSYNAVKKAFDKEGIEIKKVLPVKSFGNIDGYLLELNSDGYTVLSNYAAATN